MSRAAAQFPVARFERRRDSQGGAAAQTPGQAPGPGRSIREFTAFRICGAQGWISGPSVSALSESSQNEDSCVGSRQNKPLLEFCERLWTACRAGKWGGASQKIPGIAGMAFGDRLRPVGTAESTAATGFARRFRRRLSSGINYLRHAVGIERGFACHWSGSQRVPGCPVWRRVRHAEALPHRGAIMSGLRFCGAGASARAGVRRIAAFPSCA